MSTSSQIDAGAVADAFVQAIERGDCDAIAALYAPDAVIWHCYDGVEQSAAESVAIYRAGLPRMRNLSIEIIQRWTIGNDCLQKQVLRATAPGGAPISVPMLLHFRCTAGQITRLEEYFDSAALAPLQE